MLDLHLIPNAAARSKGFGALLALIVLTSPGCATKHDDAARTRKEGTAAGAVAGAALGAGLGALAGKNKGAAALAGAAAGGLLGAAAGHAYGDAVAKKKSGYADVETTIDGQITAARAETKKRRSYNETLHASIAEKELQLTAINNASDPESVAVERFDLYSSVTNTVRTINQRAKSWQSTIDTHKAALQSDSANPQAPALREEIGKLASEQKDLLINRDRLEAIGEKLSQ